MAGKWCSIALAMLLVIAVSPLVALAADPPAAEEKPTVYKLGDKVADFKMQGLKGSEISLEKDVLGKKAANVFIFMTTVCSACQSEVAAVSQLTRKYGDKMEIYAVAVDMRGEATVAPYAEGNDFKVTYILDPKFSIPRLFNLSYTPSVVILDKTGKVQYLKGGYSPGDEGVIQEKVLEMVRK